MIRGHFCAQGRMKLGLKRDREARGILIWTRINVACACYKNRFRDQGSAVERTVAMSSYALNRKVHFLTHCENPRTLPQRSVIIRE